MVVELDILSPSNFLIGVSVKKEIMLDEEDNSDIPVLSIGLGILFLTLTLSFALTKRKARN